MQESILAKNTRWHLVALMGGIGHSRSVVFPFIVGFPIDRRELNYMFVNKNQ